MKRPTLFGTVAALAFAVPALAQTPATRTPTPATSPAPAAAPLANDAASAAKAAAAAPGQYASDAEAKVRCGTDTVVWVDSSSHIYYVAGSKDYGKTKNGAFMCKAQAERNGNKAAKIDNKSDGKS
jgi:hypothetical protein